MHISTVNISILQTLTYETNITTANTEGHLWTCHWHTYIWPWPILKVKVKVMHILTANISKMVTDKANITIAIKYKVVYCFTWTYLDFTIAYCKSFQRSWTQRPGWSIGYTLGCWCEGSGVQFPGRLSTFEI